MQENMSILDMIHERWLNGVKYIKIEDICKITRGKVISKKTLRDTKNGKYPVYSSQTENNGELGRLTTYDYDGEYLTWTTDGAKAGTVFYGHGKFNITNVCGLLEITSENINIHYLYHVLKRIAPDYVSKGMGNPKLMSNVMSNIEIPVPPIEIQTEIANILDQFEELEKELEKELKMRIDQYEYYRNMLLNFDDSVEKKKLKDISDITIGEFIRKDKQQDIGYPVYNGGINNTRFYNDFNKNGTYILISARGANAGYINRFQGKYWAGNSCYSISVVNQNINWKYVYYYLKKYQIDLMDNQTKGGIPSISKKQVEEIEIPIPSIEVQKSIVKTLDQFDELCTSLTNGIPAEIEMRKEQYEYYRNLLLNFKNINEE